MASRNLRPPTDKERFLICLAIGIAGLCWGVFGVIGSAFYGLRVFNRSTQAYLGKDASIVFNLVPLIVGLYFLVWALQLRKRT